MSSRRQEDPNLFGAACLWTYVLRMTGPEYDDYLERSRDPAFWEAMADTMSVNLRRPHDARKVRALVTEHLAEHEVHRIGLREQVSHEGTAEARRLIDRLMSPPRPGGTAG